MEVGDRVITFVPVHIDHHAVERTDTRHAFDNSSERRGLAGSVAHPVPPDQRKPTGVRAEHGTVCTCRGGPIPFLTDHPQTGEVPSSPLSLLPTSHRRLVHQCSEGCWVRLPGDSNVGFAAKLAALPIAASSSAHARTTSA